MTEQLSTPNPLGEPAVRVDQGLPDEPAAEIVLGAVLIFAFVVDQIRLRQMARTHTIAYMV